VVWPFGLAGWLPVSVLVWFEDVQPGAPEPVGAVHRPGRSSSLLLASRPPLVSRIFTQIHRRTSVCIVCVGALYELEKPS